MAGVLHKIFAHEFSFPGRTVIPKKGQQKSRILGGITALSCLI